jgi:hypothetical protein
VEINIKLTLSHKNQLIHKIQHISGEINIHRASSLPTLALSLTDVFITGVKILDFSKHPFKLSLGDNEFQH